MTRNYIYDIETFRSVFSAVIRRRDDGMRWIFEVSRRRDQSREFGQFVRWIGATGGNMVGFNNEHFDYPVIHGLLMMPNGFDAEQAHDLAMRIINSGDRFGWTVWPNERIARQIDLFKINHFDNVARATSLKSLEFNMRLPFVQELPHDPADPNLTDEQIDDVITYNCYDVDATTEFFDRCRPQIEFREQLSAEYQEDWINANDTKIGKAYFIKRLEEARPGSCWRRGPNGREPVQTPRHLGIRLADVILPSVSFRIPEFQRVLDWLRSQTIRETKGALTDLTANVRGFTYAFGTGGIHGSVERRVIRQDETYDIVDVDVASYYPNLAIANRLAPEHLGELFCDIYNDVYEMRQRYDKSNPVNGMLKLALNGVYGDSNSEYSPFYDPQYTMSITINGQLLLCMLAEIVLLYTHAELIQINTDGMTVRIPRVERDRLGECLTAWEHHTRLKLESVDYRSMHIRDVNNYIAVKTDGKVKRKGAYETALPGDRSPLGWHQDTSALIVPKVAERVMLDGADPVELLVNHPDPFDFMLRVKVNRDVELYDSSGRSHQRLTRYHISRYGHTLHKRFTRSGRTAAVQKGWFVNTCNNATDFDWHNLELRWYADEIRQLVIAES